MEEIFKADFRHEFLILFGQKKHNLDDPFKPLRKLNFGQFCSQEEELRPRFEF